MCIAYACTCSRQKKRLHRKATCKEVQYLGLQLWAKKQFDVQSSQMRLGESVGRDCGGTLSWAELAVAFVFVQNAAQRRDPCKLVPSPAKRSTSWLSGPARAAGLHGRHCLLLYPYDLILHVLSQQGGSAPSRSCSTLKLAKRKCMLHVHVHVHVGWRLSRALQCTKRLP